jgi:hypothetical protein
MQEAAQQPISFKRKYIIADESTLADSRAASKVTPQFRSNGPMAALKRARGSRFLKPDLHIFPCCQGQAGIISAGHSAATKTALTGFSL